MPREDTIIFNDLIGKLDLLRIECPKCERVGRYRVADFDRAVWRSATCRTRVLTAVVA
jgi:hypothetical protein